MTIPVKQNQITMFEAWCKSGFQLAGHYDFTINAPIDWIITNCKEQFGLNISNYEIEELCKLRKKSRRC